MEYKMKVLLALLTVMLSVEAQKIYIGTHETDEAKGIYTSELNPETGKLSKPVLMAARPGAKIVQSSHSGLLFTCGSEKANSFLFNSFIHSIDY